MNLITMQQMNYTNTIVNRYMNNVPVRPTVIEEVRTTTSSGSVSVKKVYELSTFSRDVDGKIVLKVIKRWSETDE
jgi:hypothetical protein